MIGRKRDDSTVTLRADVDVVFLRDGEGCLAHLLRVREARQGLPTVHYRNQGDCLPWYYFLLVIPNC